MLLFLALDCCFLGAGKRKSKKLLSRPACVLSQRIFSYEAKLLALFVGEIFDILQIYDLDSQKKTQTSSKKIS